MAKRIVKQMTASERAEQLKAELAALEGALFEEKRIGTWHNEAKNKTWLVFKFTKESGSKRDLLLTKQMFQELKENMKQIELELNAKNVTWN